MPIIPQWKRNQIAMEELEADRMRYLKPWRIKALEVDPEDE